MEEGARHLTKEERTALREGTARLVSEATAESGSDVGRRLLSLLLPDPKAEAGRGGLRIGREAVVEMAETIRRKIRSREKLAAVVAGLWETGADEARVVVALTLGPLLPTSDDEKAALSVERLRGYLSGTTSPAVIESLAETVSREMEGGATDSWARAFRAWDGEEDRRLRGFGIAAFGHLLSRGKAPEKLFDALMQARRLIGDADPEIQKGVIALLAAGGRRQPRAVRRFLDRLAGDERPEVADLLDRARKRLPAPGAVGARGGGGEEP